MKNNFNKTPQVRKWKPRIIIFGKVIGVALVLIAWFILLFSIY